MSVMLPYELEIKAREIMSERDLRYRTIEDVLAPVREGMLAALLQAFEDAAKLCETRALNAGYKLQSDALYDAAEAIRALKDRK